MHRSDPTRRPPPGGLPVSSTLFIIVLTVMYLLLEMAFNARLLDVTGSLNAGDVEPLEHFGRLLSGTAVALFVLQYLLRKRANAPGHSPHGLSMVFWCLLSVVLTYGALKFLVDVMVHTTSSEFRKASSNLVLVRHEMLSGRAQIAGLSDAPDFFLRPEGKAFSALFPALGAMIWPQMERVLGPVKQDLLNQSAHAQLGGAEAFYKNQYQRAMKETGQYFQGRLPAETIQDIASKESNQAWEQYVADLHKRGWTPYSIPYRARGRVASEMNKRIGVSRNWRPDDRSGFDAAIHRQVVERLQRNVGTVYDGGKVVASGLNWPAYVAHPVVQRELLQQFGLKDDTPVQAVYASGSEFEQRLYRPVVNAVAAEERKRLDQPAAQYRRPGPLADKGFQAAQAALVPPLALWFSLLGAIAHACKLFYQITRLVLMALPGVACLRWLSAVVPLTTLLGIGVFISVSDTSATASGPHQFLRRQALSASAEGAGTIRTRLAIGVTHAVEVGQSYSYPINAWVREHVLGGFNFERSPIDTHTMHPGSWRPA